MEGIEAPLDRYNLQDNKTQFIFSFFDSLSLFKYLIPHFEYVYMIKGFIANTNERNENE